MKEVVFIRKNIDKWSEAQLTVVSSDRIEPEKLADMYLDISADLAYAQTHYPESDIVPYLNSIALKMHNNIYGKRQQQWNSLIRFWTLEIPTEVYRHRKFMLISIAIFLVANVIGIVSTLGDPHFAVDIMGQDYIDMTLRNIKNGNPMAVYGSDDSAQMMVGITMNNIFVSFRAYILGIFTCFATGLILLYNGVMCGTFMTFCYEQFVLSDCLLAMWMHGVIEITSIVIAGGAGLILGSGWMFPGSLPRGTSFRLAAKSSAKISMGLVPFFIIAGFIESYVTRYTDAPLEFRLGVILCSIVLMLFYFVYLPWKTSKLKEEEVKVATWQKKLKEFVRKFDEEE